MKVLVLNGGSSSLKYAMYETKPGTLPVVIFADRVERLADRNEDRVAAIGQALADLLSRHEVTSVDVVGHRIVHGADKFNAPVIVTDAVEKTIAALSALAPQHNAVNLAAIQHARRLLPAALQVAVFDTSFHRTLPAAAYTYAVPAEWTAAGIRRYGFHGISVGYVARRSAELLGREMEDLNIVVLHLGNGASATAVAGGRSIETSMGLTPVEGLVMGNRSGDVDPGIAEVAAGILGRTTGSVLAALTHESGLHGMCGTADMREVWQRADRGDDASRLAIDVYCHRLRKYIGAYSAILGNVDAVVFTAGIGENDARLRARVLAGLENLGICLDQQRNDAMRGQEGTISTDEGHTTVLVVPTNEEYEIACQVQELVQGQVENR